MNWPSLLPLVLGLFAIRKRLWATGWFLTVRAGSDLLRSLLKPLRAGFTKPYQGEAKILWLLTDVALFTLPPAVLLYVLGRQRDGRLYWMLCFSYVALAYPGLSGDTLVLRYYPSIYLSSYIFAWLYLVVRLRYGRIRFDDLALLGVVTMGAMSVLLILIFGANAWWAVWITNGIAYVAVLVFALAPPQI